jgi:hypothetical protein
MVQVLAVPRPVKTITGRAFVRRLRSATAREKATIAAQAMAGGVAITRLTAKQAAVISGARPFHILQARQAVGDVKTPVVRDRAAQIRRIERMLDRVVEMGGAEMLYARIDELTTPKVVG